MVSGKRILEPESRPLPLAGAPDRRGCSPFGRRQQGTRLGLPSACGQARGGCVHAQGSCLCGAIHFDMAGELSHALDVCHCSQGRKQTGHYFVSTNLERGALTLRRDESLRGHRRSRNVRRGSCPECGTTLFQGPDKGGHDFIAVAMGRSRRPRACVRPSTSPSSTRVTTTTSPTACRNTTGTDPGCLSCGAPERAFALAVVARLMPMNA